MRSDGASAAVPHLGRPWTQRVGAFVALPQLISQLGGDPDVVLSDAGLDRAALGQPDDRVPYVTFLEVLNRAAENTGCGHFGLLAGRLNHLSDLGLVGELVRNSPTVGRALEALTVHQHLNSEGGLAFLLKRGDYVDLGYASYHPLVSGVAQAHDAALATVMNIMTDLCGPTWKPYEALLPHAKPLDVAQYRAFFKVVPRFDAEYCAMRFPARDLARAVRDANPETLRRCEIAARTEGPSDFMQQVYRGLRRLMLENRHSGDDLAQLLAMHRRTLNRRLKAKGTTFQHVLDDIRFEVARDLLSNSNAHLDDIAATLGYAAVTPFMRTFRRWSGTTPGQWRRTVRTAASEVA
ncbi:MAG: AraC family transcriptional regulator [Burkholderiaceae bacterium]